MGDAMGALVDRAQPHSPAAKAGIVAGDVITAIDGRAVADAHDLARRISMMPPGRNVSLAYLHNGASKTADVALTTLPTTMVAKGDIESDSASRLGMALAPSSEMPDATSPGVVVTQVIPDSIASDHGIKAGDVILDVNGREVSTPTDCTRRVSFRQSRP